MREERKKKIFKLWRVIRGYNAATCIKYGYKPNPNYANYLSEYHEMSLQYSITEIKDMYLDLCVYDQVTSKIGETSFRTFDEKFIYQKAWYDVAIEMPFENTTIRCPSRYDEILTKAYGDWKIPKMNSAVHEMEHVDPNTPFRLFIKNRMHE